MPKYKRPENEQDRIERLKEEGILDENGNPVKPEDDEEKETKGKNPDNSQQKEQEHDWKKRHDDLRRYSNDLHNNLREKDASIAEMKAQIAELQKQNATSVPENEKELEAWVKEYPKLNKIIRSIARKEAENMTEYFDEQTKHTKEALDKLRIDRNIQEAYLELTRLHPDFEQRIKGTPEFADWLNNEASDLERNAILNPDVRSEKSDPLIAAKRAARVIAAYKLEKGLTQAAKPKPAPEETTEDEKSLASSPSARGTTPNPGGGKGKTWTESEIDKMSLREYEENEEEISRAFREGRVVLDISRPQ